MRTLLRFGLLFALLSTAPLAFAAVTVEGSLTQEHTVAPGGTYRGVITLRNAGDAATTVRLYQTDYDFRADGTNLYGDPGKMPRSNAGWIKLDRSRVQIPPQSSVRIPYEMRVPQKKNLQGTYWSVIMVEPLSAKERPQSGKGTQLEHIIRYAIQIVAHAGGDARGELKLENSRLLTEDKGGPVFVVDAVNTGERWLRPKVTLELYSPQGAPIARLEGESTRLYPGTSARFSIPVNKVPAGKYRAVVIADAGGNDLFGSQFELTVPKRKK